MNAAITKSSKEKEESMSQLTKQQMKALAALKAHQKSVIADKEQYITVLSTRLEESNQRIAALDKSINGNPPPTPSSLFSSKFPSPHKMPPFYFIIHSHNNK